MEVDECRRLIRHIRFRRATGTGAGHLLTDGADLVAASGQNFMRISLCPTSQINWSNGVL